MSVNEERLREIIARGESPPEGPAMARELIALRELERAYNGSEAVMKDAPVLLSSESSARRAHLDAAFKDACGRIAAARAALAASRAGDKT